jgi:hypothetical protein
MPIRWAAGAAWSTFLFDGDESILDERAGCARLVVRSARYAGVVRSLVVLLARRALRDRVLGVIPIEARCAGVVACQCGAVMPGAHERWLPARPTRRSSRPLRARDRWVFDERIGSALAAAERQPVGWQLQALAPINMY